MKGVFSSQQRWGRTCGLQKGGNLRHPRAKVGLVLVQQQRQLRCRTGQVLLQQLLIFRVDLRGAKDILG